MTRSEYEEIWKKELGQETYDKYVGDGRLQPGINAKGEEMLYLYSEKGGKRIVTENNKILKHNMGSVKFTPELWKKAIQDVAPKDKLWLRFAVLDEQKSSGSSGSADVGDKESYDEAMRRLQEACSA